MDDLPGIRATMADTVEAALTAPGDLDPEMRRALLARARAVAVESDAPSSVPEPLAGLADKVTRHAYRVVDADVAAALAGGYSQDAVFEAVITTALGAGLARLMCGLAALERPAPGHPTAGTGADADSAAGAGP
jgi:alkylhydroperoxidase family enzyme